jgi:DGQHR domain-containing protein
MTDAEPIRFPCLEVQQPIGQFYVGTIAAKDLVEISYADIRRIEGNDLDKILGIQRPLSKTRVSELKQYVRTVDASFPTSIILAVNPENATYNRKDRAMSITRSQNVAKIIDGQHRIAGLEGYGGTDFELNVTIFVDMDIEDQALLFATINLKQTRVSKSLAYDLYEFATSRSPQKTCHNIAKLLNSREGSPFYRKIKILGTATGEPNETLTQAAFVDVLMPYISTRPMQDRDLIKRGDAKKLSRPTVSEERKLIFRNMFIDDKDAEIARVVWNFFAAVSNKWPDAWKLKQQGNILNRTTGFRALMRLLPTAYLHLAKPGKAPAISDFDDVFTQIKLKESDFTPDRYKPGSGGESELYRDLLTQSGLPS